MAGRMTWARIRDHVFPSWAEEMARYGFDTRGWIIGQPSDGWGLYRRNAGHLFDMVRAFSTPREAEEFLNGMRTAMRHTVDPQPVSDGGKYRIGNVDDLGSADHFGIQLNNRGGDENGDGGWRETKHMTIDARQFRQIRGVLAQTRDDERE